MKKKIFTKGISGFPEFLPRFQLVENKIKRILEDMYRKNAFLPLETVAIENNFDLIKSMKKEVFGIHRLTDEQKKTKFFLHFDLTFPFARYVANNANDLIFPFKRYQIQKVWRGERPQAGRFQEFYQADIDIINRGKLPLHYEAEILTLTYDIFREINFGDFSIKLNHRDLLKGILIALDIKYHKEIFTILDKKSKIGLEKTTVLLREQGIELEKINTLLNFLNKKIHLNKTEEFFKNLDFNNEFIENAKKSLLEIISFIPKEKIICMELDLSITRGLDYYTGCVYECFIKGLENYGSICSGGRYDNLCSQFSQQSFPGVGISIGLTRLISILLQENILDKKFLNDKVIDFFICFYNENQRIKANKWANELREKGFSVELVPDANKRLNKQIELADKKDALYALFLEEDGNKKVKNLKDGTENIFNKDFLKN